MSAARDDILAGLIRFGWTEDQATEAIRDLLAEHEQKVLAAQAELMLAAERSKLELIDELRAVNRELYGRNAELFHKLRLAELELSRSEALRESAEVDSRGIRATQTSQKEALRAIRAEASASPDDALKSAVQHILKGLEL